MKKFLLLILPVLLLFCSVSAFSLPDKKKKSKSKSKDVIVMPQFPGGHKKMLDFLLVETKYPYEAYEREEVGEVIVSFRVEKDGYISMAKVLRGVSPSLDKEAVRVVRSMPNWVPGTKNGVPVPAELTIPINFKLFKKNGYYDIETDDNGIEKTTVRERKKKSKWWKGN